jgi:hypothetical protein
LDFAEARYYNDKFGRFTAVDPLLASGKSADPQTFNRYAYALNRPLRLVDSTGLQAAERAAEQKIVDDTNKMAGTFSEKDLSRFNESKDAALRMVAKPDKAGEINQCREALITKFGGADPTKALQDLKPTGGLLVMDSSGQAVPGPQNVFNGKNTQMTVPDGKGGTMPVTQYFKNNPNTSAVTSSDSGQSIIFVDDQFSSGRGELGRAQDLIHESVVHEANGRGDKEFAPPNSKNPQTDGSHAINAIIQESCNRIPEPKKKED